MNSINAHCAHSTVLTLEVMQPRPATPEWLTVPKVFIEPGSAADAVVRNAAAIIRSLATQHTELVHRDDYQAECAETGLLAPLDAVQTVARQDLLLAGAVQAVFERALGGVRVCPTSLRAQVEMQLCAIDAARAIRGLLFEQQLLFH
jgi:hypothetical protein